MNWSKAKNILIVLFICADLFLCFVIIMFTGDFGRTPSEITDTAAQIIQKSGIGVDSALLKTKITSVNIPELENAAVDKDAFAETVLGGSYTKNGEGYTSAKGTLSFGVDCFEFVPGADTNLSLMPKTPSAMGRRALAYLGISDKNIICSVSEKDGNVNLNITKQANGMRFFCSSIDVQYSKTKILKISGSWYFETGKRSQKKQLTPVSSLLIDAAAELNGEKKTVREIIPGYYIPHGGSNRLFPTPCIKVIFTDGSELIQDSAEAAD